MLHRRGSPEDPLSPQEIADKFRAVVDGCVKHVDAERIVDLVEFLETLADRGPRLELIG